MPGSQEEVESQHGWAHVQVSTTKKSPRRRLFWGTGIPSGCTRFALALSLLVNVSLAILAWQGMLTFKWKRTTFVHKGPKPLPYNLTDHIKEYQSTHIQPSCVNQSYILPPQYRDDLGRMLEAMGGFKTGVELGVQSGVFSYTMLSTWPSCQRYYLVDLWGHQGNYADGANVDDEQQLKIMESAQQRLAAFAHKTVFMRNLSTDAAKALPDTFDFVYVDARHDWCGVWADITAWWPKLRPGGIMAGHDYRGASAVWPHSDWSLCENGTHHPGAVMGAVNSFAMQQGLPVLATWGNAEWSSWIIRKPLSGGACGRLGHTQRSKRKSRYSKTWDR